MHRLILWVSVMLGLFAGKAAGTDGLVYAINARGVNDLTTFEPADPGAGRDFKEFIPYSAFAIDFDSQANVLYGISDNELLGTISTTTGGFTTIAAISGDAAGVTSFTGLSVDPTDETFYMSSNTSLYTLDPTTGVATLVGDFFAPASGSIMIDIAIDIHGNLYGHDIITDALYSIDKSTGVATFIGSTGLDANFAQGMDFDYATNTLYAAIYTGGGTGQYVEWNVTDGSVTSLFDTSVWDVELEIAVRSPAFPAPTACNPADLNDAASPSPAFPNFGTPDGIITPTDFSAFSFFFSTGDLRADINDAASPSPAFPNFGLPDGILTPTDFSAFAAYFGAGCPCTLPGCP